MAEFKFFNDDPEIMSINEALSKLSKLEPRQLRRELELKTEEQNEEVLHGSIAEIMDTQLQSNTIDRAYEAAIIQHDVARAVQIIEATGWFTDFPRTNPSFFDWISDKAKSITKVTLEQLKLLRELKKYIKDYPLETIQVEFSYTPKLVLHFKRETTGG